VFALLQFLFHPIFDDFTSIFVSTFGGYAALVAKGSMVCVLFRIVGVGFL